MSTEYNEYQLTLYSEEGIYCMFSEFFEEAVGPTQKLERFWCRQSHKVQQSFISKLIYPVDIPMVFTPNDRYSILDRQCPLNRGLVRLAVLSSPEPHGELDQSNLESNFASQM